jgi:hypothetical protein
MGSTNAHQAGKVSGLNARAYEKFNKNIEMPKKITNNAFGDQLQHNGYN